ncbi:MAG: diaminopimelate decarboxylase [Ruminococcus sp.]|nr:diaminopimelate decarboxylase [Ruminococcus sp.]
MFVSENLGTNELGHLTIGGVDTIALAQEFRTPLYVMDEEQIRKHCRSFKSSMEQFYGGNGLVCYASKAFSCKEMYRIIASEGLGVDVVSGGELYTAMAAGTDARKICFHGNNKTLDELKMALSYGVGRIVVDNIYELNTLEALCRETGKKADILFRIKPGVDAHTHDFIRTGQIDSKFGFALETGEAFEAVRLALECKNLNFAGLHCHIGSQILDTQGFEAAAEVMMTFIKKIWDELGAEVRDLNLGGGFGIQYTQKDDPLPYEAFMEAVSVVIHRFCKENNMPLPFILIEPGRSIAAPAGITLYTVGGKKVIPNIRTYVSVDGGMCDNPRYILYQSEYDALIANKADQPKDTVVTIAGKCCESGDLIGENMPLQECEPGDILAVCATGAYNYSMSSNYNRLQKPAVVFVKDGKARVAVRRESLEDLIRNDM